ncbi:MAG: hypothetical protein OQK24_05645 [Magnetovibrio sp.]|nr:hypothetical protein [Magnetovibrio sp.]
MEIFEIIARASGLEKLLWISGPLIVTLMVMSGVQKFAEPVMGTERAEKLAERFMMVMLAFYLVFTILVISSGDGVVEVTTPE